jgi:rod shape-determining protein MreD
MTFRRAAAATAAVITVLLLQATLVGPLLSPVPVSFPLLVVMVIAIQAGPGAGIGLGFAAGLLADLASPQPVGVQAICWLGAGLLAGILGGLVTLSRASARSTAALAAAIATAATVVCGGMLAVLASHNTTFADVLRYVVPLALLNALGALVLVAPIRVVLAALAIWPAVPAGRRIQEPIPLRAASRISVSVPLRATVGGRGRQ